MTFKYNAYWLGDTPFCSRCKDVLDKLIRLHRMQDRIFICQYCRNTTYLM